MNDLSLLQIAEELGHVISVDVVIPTNKNGPDKQAICTCTWRADFIRYAKHNAEHDGYVHVRKILQEVKT